MQKGIIVGCDSHQEWLLPWWWSNLRQHSDLPVAFINFGDLSDQAALWCQSKGQLIDLNMDSNFVKNYDEINPGLRCIWENIHTDVWTMRHQWFKKPFALLKSPFEKTIWFDLDCQIRGAIDSIFYELDGACICLKEEEEFSQLLDFQRGLLKVDELIYNAGVIVYEAGCEIVQKWAEEAIKNNHLFMGDQQLLSRIIYDSDERVKNLDPIYNWRVDVGFNEKAVVWHWIGSFKNAIKKQDF